MRRRGGYWNSPQSVPMSVLLGSLHMIRVVIIAILVVAAWYALLQAYRFFKNRQIDWTGFTFAVAFIVLAFYLRSVTGIG